MLLMTKELRGKLPKLYEQESLGMNATVYVKFFHPTSRYTLFVTEFDGDDTLFGYCVSPLGADCDEFGYTSLNELETLQAGPFRLGMERDRHFTRQTLAEALTELGVAAPA